jgi:hypothetical protein
MDSIVELDLIEHSKNTSNKVVRLKQISNGYILEFSGDCVSKEGNTKYFYSEAYAKDLDAARDMLVTFFCEPV